MRLISPDNYFNYSSDNRFINNMVIIKHLITFVNKSDYAFYTDFLTIFQSIISLIIYPVMIKYLYWGK